MMAAALGPPEVIAQLENAAKVLMVRMPGPENRGIRGTPAGSTASGPLSAGLAAGKGLGMNPEVVVVAWRRILHPTFPPALVLYFPELSPSLAALLLSLALGCSGVGWRVSRASCFAL